MKKLQKEMSDFCSPFTQPLRAGIKEGLYLESPLRNEFQVRPCADGEFPIFRNMKKAYCIGENGKDVMEVIGGKTDFFLRSKSGYFTRYLTHCKEYKKMFVPFFEIACNPVMPFDDDLKGKPSQEILDFLTAFAKKGLLEEEMKLFKKLRRYLKTGKGVFCFRTDVCVLQAVDPENNRIGFSVFEQVGAAVFIGEKYKTV
jgi:hypothetical protein